MINAIRLENFGMHERVAWQNLRPLSLILGVNGTGKTFIPKGTSMEPFCNEDILNMADALNQRPRRILGYHTPMELFRAFLDEVYTIDNVS